MLTAAGNGPSHLDEARLANDLPPTIEASGAPAPRMPSCVSTDRGAGSSVRKCTCEPGRSAMHAAIADKKDELAELCRRYSVPRLEVFG